LIQTDEKNGDDNIVSILLHNRTTLNGSVINHAMVITNVEKLTRLRFCSKCGLGFRTSDSNRARVNKHCEECDGKFQ
jgi:NADH pyrophosphatase NudC (nudix superfamily)